MALNENLKKYRKVAGLTQKALADKSGLSFSMVSKLESGEQANPSFETIRKIADVLNINPGSLVSQAPTIEDQIDEYLDYKRGLSKNLSRPAPDLKDGKAGQDVKFADLNFKKKLQAINDFPIPADEARFDYLDYLERRPEMKKLLAVLKNATKDEINEVTRLVETFRGISL
jgi:transcriptional regulator with XRE-family HTH domain